jgi:hypothetical protein
MWRASTVATERIEGASVINCCCYATRGIGVSSTMTKTVDCPNWLCSWRIPNLPSSSTRPGRIVAILRFSDLQTRIRSAEDLRNCSRRPTRRSGRPAELTNRILASASGQTSTAMAWSPTNPPLITRHRVNGSSQIVIDVQGINGQLIGEDPCWVLHRPDLRSKRTHCLDPEERVQERNRCRDQSR